jgi:hypothetical protein
MVGHGASRDNDLPVHAPTRGTRTLLTPARGLWSPSYWSGFNLVLRRDVATGMGYSWSAVIFDSCVFAEDGGGSGRLVGAGPGSGVE